ncbi:beta-ketoacyl synthase [Streptomyces sp. MUSC 125]|uniref:beta-ketoacyl-[acyl-carrier-protein] synthase family protein n=1 Tax=Streptomyces sp. MUSC 125 TaxID=1428624 RepID=UPI00057E2245|nr:beta-ketoacyl-[acyl-carrier-protein] synthase family protein [Streptomyces sp. MUSC 125]KIE27920.1 beta-ketoacyl synthase [Streptomyces sp. MUSC 125]
MTTVHHTAAVTGIGLFTPLGRTPTEVHAALLAGCGGITAPPEGHPVHGWLDHAGIAPPLDATEVLPPRETRCVDRFVLLALAAAADALADAGLTVGRDVHAERCAVVLGTGGGGLETFEEYAHRRAARGRPAVSPYLLPGMLFNMAAARVAIAHGIRGYSGAPVTACAAGAQAVTEGLRLIAAGQADVVVCGGSETPLHPTIASAFTNSRALASRWDDPGTASRPFDARRNGFVLGEGSGVLVLERPEHARARGATGYAELIGWGASTDAHHPTMPRPDGEGAAAAMRAALRSARLTPADITHVNAHGTGTRLGDTAEATALREVFPGNGPSVTSTKGATGHLLGASGAVEAAFCALAVAGHAVPATRNLDVPDPACRLDHVTTARTGPQTAVLSNSFAFGGHNISLVFAPPGIPGRDISPGVTP